MQTTRRTEREKRKRNNDPILQKVRLERERIKERLRRGKEMREARMKLQRDMMAGEFDSFDDMISHVYDHIVHKSEQPELPLKPSYQPLLDEMRARMAALTHPDDVAQDRYVTAKLKGIQVYA